MKEVIPLYIAISSSTKVCVSCSHAQTFRQHNVVGNIYYVTTFLRSCMSKQKRMFLDAADSAFAISASESKYGAFFVYSFHIHAHITN